MAAQTMKHPESDMNAPPGSRLPARCTLVGSDWHWLMAVLMGPFNSQSGELKPQAR
jgi:hypothetical protein